MRLSAELRESRQRALWSVPSRHRQTEIEPKLDRNWTEIGPDQYKNRWLAAMIIETNTIWSIISNQSRTGVEFEVDLRGGGDWFNPADSFKLDWFLNPYFASWSELTCHKVPENATKLQGRLWSTPGGRGDSNSNYDRLAQVSTLVNTETSVNIFFDSIACVSACLSVCLSVGHFSIPATMGRGKQHGFIGVAKIPLRSVECHPIPLPQWEPLLRRRHWLELLGNCSGRQWDRRPCYFSEMDRKWSPSRYGAVARDAPVRPQCRSYFFLGYLQTIKFCNYS